MKTMRNTIKALCVINALPAIYYWIFMIMTGSILGGRDTVQNLINAPIYIGIMQAVFYYVALMLFAVVTVVLFILLWKYSTKKKAEGLFTSKTSVWSVLVATATIAVDVFYIYYFFIALKMEG